MNERYIHWWTPHLSREFRDARLRRWRRPAAGSFPNFLWQLPQNKDFGLTDACASFVDSGRVTIYCPDAIDLDSFYNKAIHPADRMRTHNAFERVIVR